MKIPFWSQKQRSTKRNINIIFDSDTVRCDITDVKSFRE